MPLIELRAAQHLAARPEDAAVGRPWIGLGLVAPVDRGVGEGLAEAERDVDPAVCVLAAGLEQQDPGRRVFAQPGGNRAPGRTRADHDEIRLEPLLCLIHQIPRSNPFVSTGNDAATPLLRARRCREWQIFCCFCCYLQRIFTANGPGAGLPQLLMKRRATSRLWRFYRCSGVQPPDLSRTRRGAAAPIGDPRCLAWSQFLMLL